MGEHVKTQNAFCVQTNRALWLPHLDKVCLPVWVDGREVRLVFTTRIVNRTPVHNIDAMTGCVNQVHRVTKIPNVILDRVWAELAVPELKYKQKVV
jgi:hypothetical protein